MTEVDWTTLEDIGAGKRRRCRIWPPNPPEPTFREQALAFMSEPVELLREIRNRPAGKWSTPPPPAAATPRAGRRASRPHLSPDGGLLPPFRGPRARVRRTGPRAAVPRASVPRPEPTGAVPTEGSPAGPGRPPSLRSGRRPGPVGPPPPMGIDHLTDGRIPPRRHRPVPARPDRTPPATRARSLSLSPHSSIPPLHLATRGPAYDHGDEDRPGFGATARAGDRYPLGARP